MRLRDVIAEEVFQAHLEYLEGVLLSTVVPHNVYIVTGCVDILAPLLPLQETKVTITW